MPYRKMSHYPYGKGVPITCYLLHFSAPVGHARHYLGQTARSVDARVAEHRAGRGARLTRRAVREGVELILARTWPDAPRCHEQKLKNRGGFRRLCPVCNEQAGKESRATQRPGAVR